MSRFHVVSGKGGTGKTTVAAALALALAAGGRRVLLVEVEGRQGVAQVFGIEELPYEERLIAEVPEGSSASGAPGQVYALAIDPEYALLDYLQTFYRLGSAGRALRKFGAVDFATTVAPGLRDVLLTGKACEAVRRTRKGGDHVYDAVVMDAPPTGRIARFLNVNEEVAGLARVGPMHHQAQAVMRVMKSPDTAVHLVTVLEEMPVQETVDGVAELRAAGLPVGMVLVNMVRPPVIGGDVLRAALRLHAEGTGGPDAALLAGAGADDETVARAVAAGRGSTDDHLNRAALARALATAGPDGTELDAGVGDASGGAVGTGGLVEPLLAQAHEYAQRLALEQQERSAVARLGLATRELHLLVDGVDPAGLHRLAADLRAQGL